MGEQTELFYYALIKNKNHTWLSKLMKFDISVSLSTSISSSSQIVVVILARSRSADGEYEDLASGSR